MTKLQPVELIPLALLANTETGRIDSRTRLQKLTFLTQDSLRDRLALEAELQFVEYPYGPYSGELVDIVGTLQDRDLLRRLKETNLNGNAKYYYTITPTGRSAFDYNLTHSPDSDDLETISDAAQDVLDTHNDKPLLGLVDTALETYRTTAP